jgi:hypothetical protein
MFSFNLWVLKPLYKGVVVKQFDKLQQNLIDFISTFQNTEVKYHASFLLTSLKLIYSFCEENALLHVPQRFLLLFVE